jgi:hypothetical protein
VATGEALSVFMQLSYWPLFLRESASVSLKFTIRDSPRSSHMPGRELIYRLIKVIGALPFAKQGI